VEKSGGERGLGKEEKGTGRKARKHEGPREDEEKVEGKGKRR
jgi:hypothetical protein